MKEALLNAENEVLCCHEKRLVVRFEGDFTQLNLRAKEHYNPYRKRLRRVSNCIISVSTFLIVCYYILNFANLPIE